MISLHSNYSFHLLQAIRKLSGRSERAYHMYITNYLVRIANVVPVRVGISEQRNENFDHLTLIHID
jgi:hypothetical protein